MPTKEHIIEKYGQNTWDAMFKTGFLTGVTCVITPDGKLDIPQRDIDIAYRAVKGERISWREWD